MADPKSLIVTPGSVPPPPPSTGVDPRQLVGLNFGWDLVRAIEALGGGLAFIQVEVLARLRKAEIDGALKRATPTFTGVTEDLSRLKFLEDQLALLGRIWLEHADSFWVGLVDIALEDTSHPAKKQLRGVLAIAIDLARKQETQHVR